MTQPGMGPDRIVLDDENAVAAWAKRLDATPEELREAVRAVGDKAAAVGRTPHDYWFFMKKRSRCASALASCTA